MKDQPPGRPIPPAWPRGVLGVALLSVAAIVVSAVAIVLVLTRTPASEQASCRTLAWNALPDPAKLPNGWTLTAGNFYVDGAGTSAVGPAPSDGTADTPTVYLQVTCYGTDGHLAMTRLHDSALGAGSSELSFTSVGEESFATQDGSGGSSVYVRRGQLVAGLSAASTVGIADLEAVAQAADTALATADSRAALAVGPSTSPRPSPIGAAPASGSTVPASQPASSAEPSDEPSAQVHVAPDLEALMPKAIGTVALVSQSTSGTDALGQDSSSLALVTSLSQMGKKPADLQIAEAYDPNGNLDAQLLAFRVPGVTAAKLGQAVLDSWLADGASGVTTAKTTISGKQVTTVTYSDGGPIDYVYEKDAVVFDLSTSDPAIAAQTLALFP